MVSITDEQLELIRHATGNKRDGHRNYFAAGDGDLAAWRDLVTKGLATERQKVSWTEFAYFHVTDQGLDVAYGTTTKRHRDTGRRREQAGR